MQQSQGKENILHGWFKNLLIFFGLTNTLAVVAAMFFIYPKFINLNSSNFILFATIIIVISFIEVLTGFFLKKKVETNGFLRNIYIFLCLGFYILQFFPVGWLMGSLVPINIVSNDNLTTPAPPSTNIDVSNWKTYQNEYISFKYPARWKQNPKLIRGSGYTQEFTDPENRYILTYLVSGNYNQETGKPYATIDEYIDNPYKFNAIKINWQDARQLLQGEDNKNTNSVVFFSYDSESIYTITLQTINTNSNNLESDIKEGNKIFEQIIKSFKFEYSEIKTAEVLVLDGSYYGPPYDPDLYQLELEPHNHLFAKSDAVNLKDYLDKRVTVHYREVIGVIMTEQQLVIVESVE